MDKLVDHEEYQDYEEDVDPDINNQGFQQEQEEFDRQDAQQKNDEFQQDYQDQQQNQDEQDLQPAGFPEVGGQDQQQQQQQAVQQNQQPEDINYKISADNQDNIEDKISEEIEEKIKVLDDFVRGKSEEQTLNIRMHQLALAKILVFTHGKSHFKLVQAHTHLGEAYLNYKCHEQAIDHLTMALRKNGKLFNEIKDTKVYHAHILSLLGKCYLEIGSFDDALDLLNKAQEIQSQIYGEDDINLAPTLTLIANCYTKMKEYDQALEYINKVWDISEAKYGYKSQSSAFTFVESAKIHGLKQNFGSAIELQNRAIEMLIELNFDKPEYVAELYTQLGSYQEKNGDMEGYIDSLQKVKTIYQEIYGPNDKRVIKIKRQISIILLKSEQHEAALNELYETEEMETKVYGDQSLQVAKTQKIIGTILILIQHYFDAQRYLTKALKIFEENGLKKAVNEVKQKMKLVKEQREKGKPLKGNDKDQ